MPATRKRAKPSSKPPSKPPSSHSHFVGNKKSKPDPLAVIVPEASSTSEDKELSVYLKTLVQSAPRPESALKQAHIVSAHNDAAPPQSEIPLVPQNDMGQNGLPQNGAPVPPKVPLNKDEAGFLSDVEDDVIPQVATIGEDEEEVEDDDGDELSDIAPGDNNTLLTQDVTQNISPKKLKQGAGSQKILKTDFEYIPLALFAKRCTRLATCIINMFPEDPNFAVDLFSSELVRLSEEGRGDEMIAALDKVSKNVCTRDRLLRFMSYGISAVRFDIGKEARTRTSQYFDIPGVHSPNEIVEYFASDVNWLLGDRRYHHGQLDLKGRTSNNMPFRTPIISSTLRGYLIENKTKQDRLLVAYLKRIRRIPLPLIGMVTVLIGHVLQEYASGRRVETYISVNNLASHYRAVIITLRELEKKAPVFTEVLQTELYKDMMTAGPEVVPPQTYNYTDLDAVALAEQRKQEGMRSSRLLAESLLRASSTSSSAGASNQGDSGDDMNSAETFTA
ncbi:hypothetical protein D9757_013234 [Collybiopsis confluens]|uniref:DUF6532 domain-containing protein n=1 Tax=Collybiopsis confluens TaxID=2823264 RepID=A0A8H5LL49_9AGAR|nr:hypothetical protein D9757_013234 [Collybiopsis confluens]